MKYRGMKYTSGLLTAGATGIILSAAVAAKDDMPTFSELDQNSDQLIVIAELEPLASQHQKQARDLLNTYDENQDKGLDQQEFSQARNELSSQDRMAQAGNAKEPEGAKIVVEEKPAQVTVDQQPAQVTIKQGTPKVRVTTDDPEVSVNQADPEVSVKKAKPDVSVEQTDPEVVVNEAQPEVSVDESEPQVNVQSGEPEVVIREQQNRNQAQQDQGQQQAQQDQDQQQAQQQGQQQAGQAEDIYAMSIADIRAAQIHGPQGDAIGGVEEVVVKNDGSDAGLIVRTSPQGQQQGQLVYIPVEAIVAEGDQLVLDQQKLAEEAANAEQFNPQDYNPVPESDQLLNEIVGQEELTQR